MHRLHADVLVLLIDEKVAALPVTEDFTMATTLEMNSK